MGIVTVIGEKSEWQERLTYRDIWRWLIYGDHGNPRGKTSAQAITQHTEFEESEHE